MCSPRMDTPIQSVSDRAYLGCMHKRHETAYLHETESRGLGGGVVRWAICCMGFDFTAQCDSCRRFWCVFSHTLS